MMMMMMMMNKNTCMIAHSDRLLSRIWGNGSTRKA